MFLLIRICSIILLISFYTAGSISAREIGTFPNRETESFPTRENVSFPLEEFLDEFDVTSHTSLSSIQKNLCSLSTKQCSCDKQLCPKNGDCCFDYLWDPSNPINIDPYKDKLMEKMPVSLSCYDALYGIDLFMIDRCPKETKDHWLKSKCQGNDFTMDDVDLTMPVMGTNNFLYRNKFCARCHGVTTFKDVLFNLTCHDSAFIGGDLENVTMTQVENFIMKKGDQCRLDFSLVNRKYNLQCAEWKCSEEEASLCHHFLANFTTGEGDYYKNIFCRACDILVIRHPRAWSKTLSLNYFQNLMAACPSGKIYDTSSASCVQAECGPDFILINGKCTARNQVRDNRYSENRSSSCPFMTYIIIDRDPGEDIIQKHSSIFKNRTLVYYNDSITVYEVPFNESNMRRFMSLGPKIILVATTGKLHYSKLYGFTSTMQTHFSFCSNLTVHSKPLSTISPDHCICDILHHNQINQTHPKDTVSELVYQDHHFTLTTHKCLEYHLKSDCFHKTLRNSSFKILHNRSIEIIETKQVLHPSEFVPTNTGVEVCITGSKETSTWPYENLSKAQFIISVAGTSVSLLSYLLTLSSVYTRKTLGEINSGDINSYVLIILLMISDSIFVASVLVDLQTLVCKWLGISLHWSLINVCLWTMYMGFGITKSMTSNIDFTTTPTETRIKTKKRFCACITATTAFIAIFVLVNEYNLMDVQYGVGTCWIGNTSFKVYLYFIPVVISYASCIVCLVITIRVIRAHKYSVKRLVQQNQNINIGSICIKLSLILGLAEGFGLLQIPIRGLTGDKEFLVYVVFNVIYDVLRSFRGLFVSLV